MRVNRCSLLVNKSPFPHCPFEFAGKAIQLVICQRKCEQVTMGSPHNLFYDMQNIHLTVELKVKVL